MKESKLNQIPIESTNNEIFFIIAIIFIAIPTIYFLCNKFKKYLNKKVKTR